MAYIMRPSPMTELAKLLGQAAGTGARIYQNERDIGSLSNLYQQQLGYDKDASRAMARNPQQAGAFFKIEAARQKRRTEEEEKENRKRQAIEMLEGAKKSNQVRKEKGRISRALGRIGSRIFGGDPQEQEQQARYDILKKNQTIKDLDIALPKGTDDPDVSDALIDEALFKLRGTDEQDDTANAAPTAQESTTDEAQPQEDEAQAIANEQPTDNQGDQGGNPPIEAMQFPQQQSMDQEPQQPQQLGRRTPVGQPLPQGTSLEGLPSEALNIARNLIPSAASGLYSGATLPVQALEGIRGMINPSGPLSPQEQQQIGQRVGRQREIMGLSPKGNQEATNRELRQQEILRQPLNIPSREDAYKYLGGTEAKSLFEKSLNEMVGDVTEQLPLAALTGAFGGVSNALRALKGIGITQGAGNFAKWLAKEAGESDEFANTAKLGTTLLTAFGMAPQLKEVARNTYTAAENGIPSGLPVSARNKADIQSAAFELNGILNRPTSGYTGDLTILPYVANAQKLEYKDAFDAIKSIRLSDNNLSKASRVALDTFYRRVVKDLKSNPEVPKSTTELFNKAADMWRNLKNSEDAVSFIASLPVVGRALKSNDLAGLLGIGLIGTYSPTAAVLGAGTMGIKKGMDIAQALNLMSKSPAMRDYYGKVMKAALQYDGANTAKYLFGLNKMVEAKTK